MPKSDDPRNRKAVALKYNAQEDISPVIVASGYGEVAQKIIAIADENGIPIYRDDSAASLLTMLEIGSNIPTELYQVIAVIYANILRISDAIHQEQGPANG